MHKTPFKPFDEPSFEGILSPRQIEALRSNLIGRKVVLCFGAGVDSTAMIVALKAADIQPHVITMADTGGEKPETLEHVERMNLVLAGWGWPCVTMVKKIPLASTPYTDLYGNCISNETLPSLAFGLKSCSIKWKQVPQDQYLKGVQRGPMRRESHALWKAAQEDGDRIVKLIGYDCGKADMRRSAKPPPADADFDYQYPLQTIGWARPDCVSAIAKALGEQFIPTKSACWFCPASKEWELYWLAAYHPELLERALALEYRALTGRHSRFDSIEFGATWEELVKNHDRFPSNATSVGLGRSFAWCQWARVNKVTDSAFKVLRSPDDRLRFLLKYAELQKADNAQDIRTPAATPKRRVIPVVPA